MLDFFHSTYGTTLIQVTILNMIGLVSLGPDFALVMRNSLVHDKRAGMMTSLGITCGEAVHICYISLGVGVIIENNSMLLASMKILGGIYLVYIGIQMVRSKQNPATLVNPSHQQSLNTVSDFKMFRVGFITNILNPKVILFFLGLFSVVINSNTPIGILLLYVFVILITTFGWFSFVTIFFSHRDIRDKFIKVKHLIDRVTGIFLILISVKLVLTVQF
ncbi:LysE family transporter [Rickettsiaceae bacterium]|nr:LysE family transporter [Rickettsiaceae bacterium]